jgi:ADP-ribosylglycohydrolase
MIKQLLEKHIATLIGCAIGDTLGMAVEGWTREQIKKYVPDGKITCPIDPILVYDETGKLKEQDEFGKIKYYTKDLKKGEFTDDTILTLAIAETLSRSNGFNLWDIAKGHLDTYESLRMPDGKIKGGFGKTTQDAFENLRNGVSPLESGVIGGPGNAPAMKMHPLGLYAYNLRILPEAINFAEAIGKMTHLDPRSVVSGQVQTAAVYYLLDGISRQEFLDTICETCKNNEKPLNDKYTWHNSGNLTSRLEWIKNNKDADIEEAYKTIGVSSAVYQSYPFALFMFQKFWDNPIRGLLETINFGGDCDTIGAIYGALVGAKHGMIFPEEWINTLVEKDRIIELGKSLYKLESPRRI